MKEKKPFALVTAFKRSLDKFNKVFFLIMLIDFISYVAIFFTLALFKQLFYGKIQSIDIPENIVLLSEQEIFELSGAIQNYYNYFVFLVIAIIVVLMLIWSLSRAILWRLSVLQKITINYLLKSILLGFIWFGFGIIITLLILSTFKQEATFYSLSVFLIMFTYFSNMLLLKFSMTGKFNASFAALKEGLKRYDISGSFLILTIIFIALFQFLNILVESTDIFGIIIAAIVYLFYLEWSRFYLIEIYKRG